MRNKKNIKEEFKNRIGKELTDIALPRLLGKDWVKNSITN